MKIIETKTAKSVTGSFFKVYVNGVCIATRTTYEAAKLAGEEILEKRVFRS